MGDDNNIKYPYTCELQVAFPTAWHAEQTMRVLQVDQEVDNSRVTKSFSLEASAGGDGSEEERNVMKV